MPNTIKVKRGKSAALNTSTEKLQAGEILYNLDKNYLTVGAEDNDALTKKPVAAREIVGYTGDTDSKIGTSTTEAYSIKYDTQLKIKDGDNTLLVPKKNGTLATTEDITAELENYYTKTESDAKYSHATNIENGTGTGSLAQKRLKSDGITWTTAKAYQGASMALGGGTQAGRTEAEFNAYFWDSANNEPINGGKGKNSDGKILDNNGLTYEQSYSYAVAEGELTKALGRSSHAEGNNTKAIGTHSHAEGISARAEGYAAHAEGNTTNATGAYSHSEGTGTNASGENSHAEGANTKASGTNSHAEGSGVKALGSNAHAEGGGTTASGDNSHAEGFGTVASNAESHAEGHSTTASGLRSHAEGMHTQAIDMYSHTEGYYTKSSREAQHVEGKFNADNPNALQIVGNGTSDTDRKNAFVVLEDGRAKVQSAPTENDDVVRKIELDSVKTIANKAVVANSAITAGTHTKITYDSKGLVTGGTELVASDIPNIPASKITSGTFSDDRIASASVWNAKLDSSVLTQEQVDSLF